MAKPTLPALVAVALALQLVAVPMASAASPGATAAPHDHATHDHGPPAPMELPALDTSRGVVPTGLAVASDGPCAGALEIVDGPAGQRLCTHGPDAAPLAMGDVRTADMTPEEALQIAAAAPPFTCDGDGSSGRRAHAIYAVAPDRTDRFASYQATFRSIIATVQDEYRQSSYLHGASDALVYRFTHTTPSGGTCQPLLDHVVLPSTTSDDSFGATITALEGMGYTDPTRRYLVFVDAQVLCGIAQLYGDDRADASVNWNNSLYSAMFSRVDAGCWGYAETHELTHNIGGVQDSAPHASGAGHCNDEHDIMCYADGGPLSALFTACGSTAWERRLDCGGDDYFDPSPAGGSYLATHWNVARSSWLFTEGGAAPEPDPSSGATARPTVRILTPTTGYSGERVVFSGTASDADGDLARVRIKLDGRAVATLSTNGSWARTLTLSVGSHRLAVVAVDDGGRVSAERSVSVTVLAPSPVDITGLFVDDDGSIFEAAIAKLAAQGVTRGCNPPTNDRYCPDEAVTRGQMAAFLTRALNLPRASGVDFVDDNGSIFEDAIERLAAAGITRGCNPPANDQFCPDEPVTRAQMAAFLTRALNLPRASGVDFVDDDGSIFEDAIERLAAAGITRGCNPPTNDRYCPDEPVTRAQMAAFLVRALYS